jgi:hypothetical protein
MTTCNPSYGKPAATECPETINGRNGVLGTGWMKTAMLADKGTQQVLIETNADDQDFSHAC